MRFWTDVHLTLDDATRLYLGLIYTPFSRSFLFASSKRSWLRCEGVRGESSSLEGLFSEPLKGIWAENTLRDIRVYKEDGRYVMQAEGDEALFRQIMEKFYQTNKWRPILSD